MFSSKDIFFAPSATTGYQIAKSLRFRAAASDYLNRTLSTPTNNKIFTWSAWVKIGNIPAARVGLFTASNAGATSFFGLEFNSSAQLNLFDSNIGGANVAFTTTPVFRDPSAWYHIVLAVDTTQATASNRNKLYINGAQITTFGTAVYSTLNSSPYMNSAVAHAIGSWQPANTLYLDGYMAEVNFIDGQQLTPSSFGATDAVTGAWRPVAYAGTYGNNGSYLKFTDVGATSGSNAGYGKDFAGTNYWTTNNFGTTSTAITYDSMTDTPTPYSDSNNGVGNYCVISPIDKSSNITLSNANLTATQSSAGLARSTFGMTTDKWYWEITVTDATSAAVGIAKSAGSLATYPGGDANSWSYASGGNKFNNGSGSAYGSSYTTNDVLAVAFDATNGALYFGKISGGTITWQNSGNPTSGATATGAAFTSLTSGPYFPTVGANGAGSFACNFGQRPFAASALPSGYKTLNTQNIAAGSITTSGSFTGNGSTDGPFVWLNGVPTAMTINGNAVTFATHADKLANGFKVRSSSASYNTAGSNTYSITTTGAKFKDANAQGNP